MLALTILMDVAAESPWTNLVAVPNAPNNHLRCVPVFPQHTALWDEVLAAPPEGGVSRDLATDLKTAVGDSVGTFPVTPGLPRMYGVELSYNFR